VQEHKKPQKLLKLKSLELQKSKFLRKQDSLLFLHFYMPLCPKLVLLNLSGNSLYGNASLVLSKGLQKLPLLKELILVDCDIESIEDYEIDETVSQHKNLQILDLSENPIEPFEQVAPFLKRCK